MTCPLCGHDEGRERCNWPMPDSPLEFFGPETWLDDDQIDRENLALRLPAPEFDREQLAELLKMDARAVWIYVGRDALPRPDHYEDEAPRGRAVWKAEQLVGLVGV